MVLSHVFMLGWRHSSFKLFKDWGWLKSHRLDTSVHLTDLHSRMQKGNPAACFIRKQCYYVYFRIALNSCTREIQNVQVWKLESQCPGIDWRRRNGRFGKGHKFCPIEFHVLDSSSDSAMSHDWLHVRTLHHTFSADRL